MPADPNNESYQSRQGRTNDDIEKRVVVLEYQFTIVMKQLERIEAKQDAAIRQIDTLRYVSGHEFDQFKEYVAKNYVSNDANRPMKTLFWAIITTAVLGLFSLGMILIQNQLKS